MGYNVNKIRNRGRLFPNRIGGSYDRKRICDVRFSLHAGRNSARDGRLEAEPESLEAAGRKKRGGGQRGSQGLRSAGT